MDDTNAGHFLWLDYPGSKLTGSCGGQGIGYWCVSPTRTLIGLHKAVLNRKFSDTIGSTISSVRVYGAIFAYFSAKHPR